MKNETFEIISVALVCFLIGAVLTFFACSHLMLGTVKDLREERDRCWGRYDEKCEQSIPTIKINASDYFRDYSRKGWWTSDGLFLEECCYPSDCPQARDNPKECKCFYGVDCIQGGYLIEAYDSG